ncbi:TPA: ATP-binding cassette domain-containing protein [Streptococcus suis]|nr:ATP-binding cassette domain-containing protein [Streptococcus suis]HEM4990864.1 ATP-binding cassette domain-containing protein [Streptococcus suis]HEM5207682.1 ATP-binding cassette domain-containing protein [Streptococcus suis]HEM5228206.1 ATP-binding cassette domain-containing protein [Streptococcus suis]HEM5238561.1 ATP-binding cassette domain-containing protein [Streptococcus suis]
MANTLLNVTAVSKTYGKQKVLDNISFDINCGEICGLVGENGAGKTTLIRILAGLISSNSGEISGLESQAVSCIVESPALYPHLSAGDNLRVQMIGLGIGADIDKVKNLLRMVGLEGVDSKKKVKDFSLGMKQRLAIALAICDWPKLLILDEPINGLDPVGIKEIREILLLLKNEYRMTILVSSHILSELDLVVDKYIIMSKGKVLQIIQKDALQNLLQTKRIVRVDKEHEALEVLLSEGIEAIVTDEGIELSEIGKSTSWIIDCLRKNEIQIEEIIKFQLSFESYYLSLITREEVPHVP